MLIVTCFSESISVAMAFRIWKWRIQFQNILRQKLIHFRLCFVGFRMTIIWGGENILVCVLLSRRVHHDEGWETRQGNAAAVTQIDAGKMWEPGSRQKCETLCRKSRNQREVKLRPSGPCTGTLEMYHEKNQQEDTETRCQSIALMARSGRHLSHRNNVDQ